MSMILNMRARSSTVQRLAAPLGKLDLYGGPMPTSADADVTAVLLASFDLRVEGHSTSPVAWLPAPVETVCQASGVATWGRWYGEDPYFNYYIEGDYALRFIVILGSVGTANADFLIDNVNLTIGSDVWLNSLRLGMPAS